MTRDIITIDEKKCNGCGLCVQGCPEGALQLIEGKARLVGDLYCDGLGACIGECPEGAITVERREAEPYDEDKVMDNVMKQGKAVVRAHLAHLEHHHADAYHTQALAYLKKHGHDTAEFAAQPEPCGCPGSQSRQLSGHRHGSHHGTGSGGCEETEGAQGSVESRLSHWPVQLHLINPGAEQYRKKDVLLAADCTAFAMGNFHQSALNGKSLAIACPKLDSGKDIYVDKLRALIDSAQINTLTVMIMEVPCCRGLLALAQEAMAKATRKVPVKLVQVSVEGEIQKEEWI
ncbi:MAG: 4Fe-4S dicluster domain-containing protein [Spirochaetales bacterium]|nr:MAG: 4Fe-4S dicluster domain-containing protein [Spirochaetales bacterium]